MGNTICISMTSTPVILRIFSWLDLYRYSWELTELTDVETLDRSYQEWTKGRKDVYQPLIISVLGNTGTGRHTKHKTPHLSQYGSYTVDNSSSCSCINMDRALSPTIRIALLILVNIQQAHVLQVLPHKVLTEYNCVPDFLKSWTLLAHLAAGLYWRGCHLGLTGRVHGIVGAICGGD